MTGRRDRLPSGPRVRGVAAVAPGGEAGAAADGVRGAGGPVPGGGIGAPTDGRPGRPLAWAFGLFLLGFLPVALTLPEYGLTWDEPYYFRAADLHVGWLGQALNGLARGRVGEVLADGALGAAWGWNPSFVPHPPVSRILAGLGRAALSPPLDPFVAYRLPTAILFGLLVATLGLWVGQLWGRAIGLVGALLTVLTPQLFGHAHFALTDLPLTALWWLTAYAFWRGIERWPWSMAAGVLWGLALATKFPAVLVPLPLLVWAHLYRRREYANNVMACLLLGPAVMVAVNPGWWRQPVARVLAFFLESASRGLRPATDFPVYFLGEYSRASSLPGYAASLMAAVTLPEVVLVLALVGLLVPLAPGPRRQARALWALSAAAILGSAWVPGAVLHDVSRLFLPATPFVVALAASGFGWLAARLDAWLSPRAVRQGVAAARTKLVAALALLLLWLPAVELVLYHPYQLSYFNRLVGGVRGAYRKGFEVTAALEAFTPRFLAWLDHELPPGTVLNASFANFLFLYYRHHGRLRADLQITDSADYDYYVLLNRPSAYRRDPLLPIHDPALYLDDWAFVRSRPVLCTTWDLHGVPLILIFAPEARGCGPLAHEPAGSLPRPRPTPGAGGSEG